MATEIQVNVRKYICTVAGNTFHVPFFHISLPDRQSDFSLSFHTAPTTYAQMRARLFIFLILFLFILAVVD